MARCAPGLTSQSATSVSTRCAARSMLEDVSEQIIKIQLPDGSVREVPRGTTAYDVATSISPRLAAAVVVARIRPLTTAATTETTEEETASEEAMYGANAGGERLVDL